MIIDTDAILTREEIAPALAVNLLSDVKTILNSISLKLEGGSGDITSRGSIAGSLLQAFGEVHDAEQMIRKRFKLD